MTTNTNTNTATETAVVKVSALETAMKGLQSGLDTAHNTASDGLAGSAKIAVSILNVLHVIEQEQVNDVPMIAQAVEAKGRSKAKAALPFNRETFAAFYDGSLDKAKQASRFLDGIAALSPDMAHDLSNKAEMRKQAAEAKAKKARAREQDCLDEIEAIDARLKKMRDPITRATELACYALTIDGLDLKSDVRVKGSAVQYKDTSGNKPQWTSITHAMKTEDRAAVKEAAGNKKTRTPRPSNPESEQEKITEVVTRQNGDRVFGNALTLGKEISDAESGPSAHERTQMLHVIRQYMAALELSDEDLIAVRNEDAEAIKEIARRAA